MGLQGLQSLTNVWVGAFGSQSGDRPPGLSGPESAARIVPGFHQSPSGWPLYHVGILLAELLSVTINVAWYPTVLPKKVTGVYRMSTLHSPQGSTETVGLLSR